MRQAAGEPLWSASPCGGGGNDLRLVSASRPENDGLAFSEVDTLQNNHDVCLRFFFSLFSPSFFGGIVVSSSDPKSLARQAPLLFFSLREIFCHRKNLIVS